MRLAAPPCFAGIELDLLIGRARCGFVEDAAAIAPQLRHETVRRIAGILASHETVTGNAELVVNLLGIFDDVVPGCRSLVRIEAARLKISAFQMNAIVSLLVGMP
jgi:hypothetical protein